MKLKCTGKGCGKMLPRDDFYDDPKQKARGNKGFYCKACVKRLSNEGNAKMAQRVAEARARIQAKPKVDCCDKRENVVKRRCLGSEYMAGKKRHICIVCFKEYDRRPWDGQKGE